MLIKLIITEDEKLQIETFDIDMEKNRICKISAANRGSYIQNLNDFILKDIHNKRIIPE